MHNWITQLALWWLDMRSEGQYESCNAYGGAFEQVLRYKAPPEDKRVRICKKRRWHTDSHAYEWCSTSAPLT